MYAVEIVKKLPAWLDFITQRIGDFDIEKPTFSQKAAQEMDQVEIKQVLNHMRRDNEVIRPVLGGRRQIGNGKVIKAKHLRLFGYVLCGGSRIESEEG